MEQHSDAARAAQRAADEEAEAHYRRMWEDAEAEAMFRAALAGDNAEADANGSTPFTQ